MLATRPSSQRRCLIVTVFITCAIRGLPNVLGIRRLYSGHRGQRLRGHTRGDEPAARSLQGPGQEPTEFFRLCKEQLSQENVQKDGRLSQEEYALFLYGFCSKHPAEGPACKGSNKDFVSLPLSLQFEFAQRLCGSDSYSPKGQEACLDFLNGLGEAFYYPGEDIDSLCRETGALLTSSGLLLETKRPCPPGKGSAILMQILIRGLEWHLRLWQPLPSASRY
jgi:hypothetical protein